MKPISIERFRQDLAASGLEPDPRDVVAAFEIASVLDKAVARLRKGENARSAHDDASD